MNTENTSQDVLGLQTIVQALIETHPEPEALLQRLQEAQQRGSKDLDAMPDIQRFHCEQVIDSALDYLQQKSRG